MRRPRVLHVTTADISLAILLGPQLRAMQDAGYEVLGASAPGPFVDQLQSWGITHLPIRHATRSMSPTQDALSFGEMYRCFRTVRADIVHTHLIKPSTFGRPAAWLARAPHVVDTVHGLYATPQNGWIRRTTVYNLERLMSRCASFELVQNPEDLELLATLGLPREKLVPLGNGVDLSVFDRAAVPSAVRGEIRRDAGVGDDDVLVGLVGRLVWEKGFREVFAAAEVLKHSAPRARLVVVGPAEETKSDGITSEGIARAEAAGVTFLGMRHDMAAVYSAFDLFLLASYREGFSRSGMEAAAMSLPLITTDIRGCRQVVEHGQTGLLVPLGDVEAMVAAVERLTANATERAAMGTAGRRKAEREFDQQTVIDITLRIYEQLLGSVPERTPS